MNLEQRLIIMDFIKNVFLNIEVEMFGNMLLMFLII